VIVGDFDVFGSGIRPSEADSVLVIDAHAVLPGSIALQLLELVPRRAPEVLEAGRRMQPHELSPGDGHQLNRQDFSGT
jgi:hypothetical protein